MGSEDSDQDVSKQNICEMILNKCDVSIFQTKVNPRVRSKLFKDEIVFKTKSCNIFKDAL